MARTWDRKIRDNEYQKWYQRTAQGKSARQKYYESQKGKAAILRNNQKQQQKRRDAVFNHYGNACARCGFSDRRALSIDHIEGGGNEHRKKMMMGRGGSRFYEWLIRSNFPDGFQTLCMNCQFIKRHENDELRKRSVKIVDTEDLPLFRDIEG